MMRGRRLINDRAVYLVLGRAILGMLVVRVEKKDGASQHVHDVRRNVAHDHGRREPVGELALRVDHLDEAIELPLRGQLAHEEQVAYLLVAVAAVVRRVAEQIVQIVAAEAQKPVVGALLAVGDDVAVHVGDVRHPREHAGAVGVAQPALHVVALVEARVDRVDLEKVSVEANLKLFLLADLDGALLVGEGGVQAPHEGFVDFHGHAPHLPLVSPILPKSGASSFTAAFRGGKLS